MKKYLEPKYIIAIIFGLLVVYVVNKNVDILFQSRLAQDSQPLPTKAETRPQTGMIQTH